MASAVVATATAANRAGVSRRSRLRAVECLNASRVFMKDLSGTLRGLRETVVRVGKQQMCWVIGASRISFQVVERVSESSAAQIIGDVLR